MPDSPHNLDSVDRIVRAGLAAGDRRRRGREATRQIWRAAPTLAAAGLCIAALTRWAGFPAAVPIVVLLVGACALLLFAYLSRRELPISDAVANALDNDAGMRGELRSASWFAERATRDEWADFHLAKAAEHLQRIDWANLYPPVSAKRAQVTTAGLLIATLVLTVTMPERMGARPAASAAGKEAAAEPAKGTLVGRMLDPELQKRLEALLAAAASGTLPTAEAMATDADLREMLNKLGQMSDAELIDALERALAANPDAQTQAATQGIKKLAEQARHAAEEGTLPKYLEDALEKLSDKMELAVAEEDADGSTQAAGPAQQGQQGADSDASDAEELTIQFAKQAEAGGGAGMMMMSSADTASQAGGPPGSGVGGSGSQDAAAAATAAIEAALKQEMVEASQDSPGENVDTEIRRKTEHGNATVTFTGSASGNFDRTRAAAAPPVPEARRSGVQSYFVRKPQ